MIKNIKFSIIMPCYNLTKQNLFIDLLKKQLFKSFELVLINDCSTDNTQEICNSIKIENERFFPVSIIEHKTTNQGPGPSRNDGLEICSGEFVIFLDSDDYLDENCLKALNDITEGNNVDCILFDYSKCYDEKTIDYKSFEKEGFISLYDAFLFAPNGVCGKCLRRTIIIENDLKFLPLKRNEDFPFFRHFFLLTEKIYYLQKPYYKYVMHDSSLMHNDNLIDVNNATKAFDYLSAVCSDQELLGYLFMNNCYYSNVMAMLSTNVSRKAFFDRILFLKEKYNVYYSIRFLKPYSIQKKTIVLLSRMHLFFCLKFLVHIVKSLIKN